jgi:hemerythrin-like domain-containing protein
MASAIDVSDMYPVHNAFRDTLSAAPHLLGTLPDGDEARRELVGNFYRNIIAFLHVHHHGEEELIFPFLRQRCPDDLTLIDVIAAQHRDVDGLVGESVAALDQLAIGAPEAQTQAADTLRQLGVRMTEHLDDEENRLLPICSAHMNEQEWGALPGHAMGAFAGDKIWLILGLIRERMNDEQRARMLANMPPPAVEMWTTIGEASFQSLMAEIGPLQR